MLKVNVNFKVMDHTQGNKGQIKDVAGVNGTPISIMPGFPDLEDQFNQMGITHLWMHDTYGIGDIDNGADSMRETNFNQLIINVPPDLREKAKNLFLLLGIYGQFIQMLP